MSGPTRAVDWDARYQAERTPWERPTLNAAFLAWRVSGALSPCRILLPGAGRSGEPLALARAGFDVTVVDSAPTPLAVQRSRFEVAAQKAALHQADLLEWAPSQPFAAIYDQTCLCALPPATWPAYAARLHDWLQPGGSLFILFMQTGAEGGPPFDCPTDAMRALFATGWEWPATLGQPEPRGQIGAELPVILRRT